MRRLVLSFVTASLAIALVVACTGRDRAGAQPLSSAPLYREAVATAAAAGQPVPGLTSLAPLIARLKPAVVNISTTTVIKDPHARLRGHGGMGEEPFERFFGMPLPDESPERRGQSLGSGFLLNAEGYILTNNHVVKDATDIRVRLSDNTEYAAKVIGKDPVTDVALIKLTSPPRSLPTVVLGDSDALEQGDFVLALGSPFGLRDTATFGIVSAKHRVGVNPGGTYDDFIQTDAAINPGNSGGPLFNLRGEVIGINTAIVSPQIGQGIGFAVPIDLAKSLLPQLRSRGKVVRGYVGVAVSDLSPELAKGLGLSAGLKGALVQQVVDGTPARAAGLEPGDVITGLDGKAVETSSALTRGVALVPPGEKLTLTILRGGAERKVTLAVAQRPDDEALVGKAGAEDRAGEETGKSPKLGVKLQALTPEIARQLGVRGDEGVVVAAVIDGGPAEQAGLRQGDVLVEVNRRKVAHPAEVAAAIGKLKDGDIALLRVRRGDAALFVAVPVGGVQ